MSIEAFELYSGIHFCLFGVLVSGATLFFPSLFFSRRRWQRYLIGPCHQKYSLNQARITSSHQIHILLPIWPVRPVWLWTGGVGAAIHPGECRFFDPFTGHNPNVSCWHKKFHPGNVGKLQFDITIAPLHFALCFDFSLVLLLPCPLYGTLINIKCFWRSMSAWMAKLLDKERRLFESVLESWKRSECWLWSFLPVF